MKKIILLSIFLLMCCVSFSQSDSTSWKQQFGRHELQLTVSDPLMAAWVTDRIPFFISCYREPDPTNPYTWFEADTYKGWLVSTGTWSLSYSYRLCKWFWLGGYFSYTGFYQNVYDRLSGKVVERDNLHYMLLMASMRFSWLNKSIVTLYSGLDLGMSLEGSDFRKNQYGFYDDSAASIALQLTAVGVQVGKNWYGCTEFGLGMKGFVSMGFGYHFKNKKSSIKK
ncbi:MAG: hypothetical protein J5642_05220 [Bacteroidales bacterium]|nr:hypothetical protein [Bacteroidales bacterium]